MGFFDKLGNFAAGVGTFAKDAGNFTKNLGKGILANGKLLSGYVLNETTLTSLPGIKTALITAVTDATPAAYIDLGIQVIMLAGAAHRAGKITKDAVQKTIEDKKAREE